MNSAFRPSTSARITRSGFFGAPLSFLFLDLLSKKLILLFDLHQLFRRLIIPGLRAPGRFLSSYYSDILYHSMQIRVWLASMAPLSKNSCQLLLGLSFRIVMSSTSISIRISSANCNTEIQRSRLVLQISTKLGNPRPSFEWETLLSQ